VGLQIQPRKPPRVDMLLSYVGKRGGNRMHASVLRRTGYTVQNQGKLRLLDRRNPHVGRVFESYQAHPYQLLTLEREVYEYNISTPL